MDIVITYVNGFDPLWQKDYEQYTNTPIMEKRFRDWDTLRFLFRGIAANMPFIRKVFLVVSQESQIPQWINRERVDIILHKDIIPSQYLPTFNSNTIEMHLHRIEDLDEQYLYFNDDMFPIAPCEPTDFFRKGKIVISFSKHLLASGMFKQICKNSDRLARKALGLKASCLFLRPQHICSPMLRSQCYEVYEKVKDEIESSLTRTRIDKNYTQYLFLDYIYLKGMAINEKISKKHFSTAIASANSLRKFILHPTRKLMCVNDVKLSEKRYHKLRTTILEAFNMRFPQKCIFEQ